MSGDLGAPVNGEWPVRCIMASTRKVSADAQQLCARNARTKYLLDYVAADARPDWQPYENLVTDVLRAEADQVRKVIAR